MKNISLVKLFFGGLLIFLGAGFLADQFLGVNFSSVLSLFWPGFLMVVGLYIILKTRSHIILGSIIFVLGAFTFFDDIFNFPFSIWNLWPLILVAIGLNILFGKRRDKWNFKHNSSSNRVESSDDKFESFAFFWGDSRKVKSSNFKKGSVVAIFGGSEIDLRDAAFAKEGAEIEVLTIFGATNIIVSSDILVKSEGLGIFGGFADETSKPEKVNGKVKITGVSIFGGVAVENK